MCSDDYRLSHRLDIPSPVQASQAPEYEFGDEMERQSASLYARQTSLHLYNSTLRQSCELHDRASDGNGQSMWTVPHPGGRAYAYEPKELLNEPEELLYESEEPSYDMQYLQVASPTRRKLVLGSHAGGQAGINIPLSPTLCASPSPRGRTKLSLKAKLDREACLESSRSDWLKEIQAERAYTAFGPWAGPQPDISPRGFEPVGASRGGVHFGYADHMSARSLRDTALQHASPRPFTKLECSSDLCPSIESSPVWAPVDKNAWIRSNTSRDPTPESPPRNEAYPRSHISREAGRTFRLGSRASSLDGLGREERTPEGLAEVPGSKCEAETSYASSPLSESRAATNATVICHDDASHTSGQQPKQQHFSQALANTARETDKKRYHRGVSDKTWLPFLCLPALSSRTEKRTSKAPDGAVSDRRDCSPYSKASPYSKCERTPRAQKGSVTSRLKSFFRGQTPSPDPLDSLSTMTDEQALSVSVAPVSLFDADLNSPLHNKLWVAVPRNDS